jgi:hypothetical protein
LLVRLQIGEDFEGHREILLRGGFCVCGAFRKIPSLCFGICARIPKGIIIVFAYIRHCPSLYLEIFCSICYNFSLSIAIGGLSGIVSGNA